MNWNVFTQEEQDYIKDLAKKGQWDLLASAVNIQNPEQEYWLNYFIDKNKPITIVEESKVKKELEKELSKSAIDNTLDSPEKEAEWQAKLDAEKTEQEEKVKVRRGRKPKVQ